jgi:hypothetical protein
MRPVKAAEPDKPYTAQSPYRLRELFIPTLMKFFFARLSRLPLSTILQE